MAEYRCENCDYIYIEDDGDPDNRIAPGTLFVELPDDYRCPGCDAIKNTYMLVGKN